MKFAVDDIDDDRLEAFCLAISKAIDADPDLNIAEVLVGLFDMMLRAINANPCPDCRKVQANNIAVYVKQQVKDIRKDGQSCNSGDVH